MSILQNLNNLTNEQILEISTRFYSASDYLRSINVSTKGQYGKIINDKLKQLQVSWKKPVSYIEKTPCPVCGALFVRYKNTKRKQITCSTGCANTYFRSGKDNNNYKNGISSYRKNALSYYGAVCNRCSYHDNHMALVVHHVDRDRTNNNLENLEVLCANCHTIEHYNDPTN